MDQNSISNTKVIKILKINFKNRIITGFLLVLVIFINTSICLSFSFTQSQNEEDIDAKSLLLSQTRLPDKVYTFFAPNDKLTFENLFLYEYCIYYIRIELVTPHDVSTMRIRIWDPENSQYNIFESAMFWDPEYDRYFEIPFGTALRGNYTLEFYIEASKNVNIYVKIFIGPMCLHDKLAWQDIENTIFYEVRKFHNDVYIEHELLLTTDTMYKYYFARVSAISLIENNDIYVDINITDAIGTEFEMCAYIRMQNIDGLNGFCFGTSNGGTYTLKFKIYCTVENVNVALAVVRDYVISSNDPNQTVTHPEDNTPNIIAYISTEWTIDVIIFVGICCGVPIVMITYRRKKNDSGMKFKRKLEHDEN